MQITTESRKVRWLGLIGLWFVIAALLYWHALVVRKNVDMLGNAGLRGAPVAPTPLHRICPTMYADAQMWVRHALALAKGAGPQLRYTYVDNAPYGREVHWDSGFAWLIVAAGYFRHVVFGEPLPTGVENALPWFNLPLLLGFVVIFTIWISRRAGLGAAVILGMAMLGNPDFYSGFSPNYVDHHGVLAAAVLGLTLGAALMGGGFLRSSGTSSAILPTSLEAARRAAVFSAACGALGMWVSAATLVPAIAIVGIAGGTVTMLHSRRRLDRSGIVAAPDIWRLWGTVGGLASFGLYLLEYAPSHLGFRLEVNHPAYDFAWWGAGEILAQLAEWRSTMPPSVTRRGLRRAAAVAAVLSVPIIIAIGGAKVFVVFDPFVARLSPHVAEGVSFFSAIKLFGWGRLWIETPWLTATIGLAMAWVWRGDRTDRPVLLFCALAFGCSVAMALKQIRWWPSASGPEICFVLAAIAVLARRQSTWARWTWVILTIALTSVPPIAIRIAAQQAENRAHAVEPTDAIQPIYRDIARALRASQPTGDIVLLSSPNASVAIGYYGEFKTIGTLYWENLDGTKAAAEMFSAGSDVARQLLRARGVTHVAMISLENFLAEYYNLLHPGAPQEEFRTSFGYQLLAIQQAPIWLEQIPYEMPLDTPARPDRVLLFKTHFGSAKAEQAYDAALQAVSAGKFDEAESRFDDAIASDPKIMEYRVLDAHLLLSRGKFAAALAAISSAIDCAPATQQLPLCVAEAKGFYTAHAHAAALQLYERAIQMRYDDGVMNDAAWIMATSTDDSVRNGRKALELSESLVQEHPKITCLSTYAAALAENGRFDEAVQMEERVIAMAREGGQANLVPSAEARLQQYRERRPWRQ